MSTPDSVVLIVDDDHTNRLYYRRVLERIPGVKIVCTESGRQALDYLSTGPVDLILLDVMMPGMSGFEVAREINALLAEAAPPIVFITAHESSLGKRQEGFAQGGVDFLYKPVDLETLSAKITALLRMQRLKVQAENALAENARKGKKIAALLAASKDVMAVEDFPVVARKLFDRCKEVIGARAGYVALLSKDGSENELLFLDSGGMPCTVPHYLPMPIRGLREVAYAEKRTVYDNDFHQSRWMEFIPEGHVELTNVLFAPLVIQGVARGLLGLANKPGGFTDADAEMAEGFGELAAMALLNSLNLKSLRQANRLMSAASRLAGLGAFEWDPAADHMLLTDGLCVILGLAGAVDEVPLTRFLGRLGAQDQQAVRAVLENALAKGQAGGIEFRGGGDLANRAFRLQASVSPGSGGSLVIGACQDITNLKEIEARALHTQKMDSIGHLAAGLAHEINNPLQYVTGNLDFIDHIFGRIQALAPLDKDGDLKAGLEKVEEAMQDCRHGLNRVQAIVLSMLRFAQSSSHGQSYCDLATMLNDVALISRKSWEDVAELTIEIEPGLRGAGGISGEISNCLLNLLLNAAEAVRLKHQATGKKGRITMGARGDGPRLDIWVEDTGTGIPEAIRDKIFNPFFTTRETGLGTGMGLAISHAAVHQLGGEMRYETVPGEGTTFHIFLPAGQG